MPLAVVENNLIKVLAALTISGISFLICLMLWHLKLYVGSLHFEKRVQKDKRFREYQNVWYFIVAWLGTCVLIPLLFSLTFNEIYDFPSVIDETALILGMYPTYLMLMVFWMFVQYIVFKSPRLAFVFLALAIGVAVLNIVLIFRMLSDDWHHWLTILLLLPPIFGVFATNTATTFRVEIASKILQDVATVHHAHTHSSKFWPDEHDVHHAHHGSVFDARS